MGGVETDKDYPNIMDENDNCMFDKNKIKAKVIGCESYLNLTEENLRKLVYHQGPLSIGKNFFNHHCDALSLLLT